MHLISLATFALNKENVCIGGLGSDVRTGGVSVHSSHLLSEPRADNEYKYTRLQNIVYCNVLRSPPMKETPMASHSTESTFNDIKVLAWLNDQVKSTSSPLVTSITVKSPHSRFTERSSPLIPHSTTALPQKKSSNMIN